MQKNILQLRLKNCIQTILEMDYCQENGNDDDFFTTEISTLKIYLQQIDKMVLVEDDVKRLEDATAVFLTELKLTVFGGLQQNKILQ